MGRKNTRHSFARSNLKISCLQIVYKLDLAYYSGAEYNTTISKLAGSKFSTFYDPKKIVYLKPSFTISRVLYFLKHASVIIYSHHACFSLSLFFLFFFSFSGQ